MADAVDNITDEAIAELGQVTAVAEAEAAPVVAPTSDAKVEGTDTDVPLEDLSNDELIARVQSQDKEQANFRSLTDRHMNEMREAQKASQNDLKAIAEAMLVQSEAAKAVAKPQAQAVDQKALYAEMGERFMPDDPEQGAKLAQMFDELGGKWVGRMENTLDSRLGETKKGMQTLDPDYRQHKETVDELVTGGMPFDAALKFAKSHAGPSKGAPAVQPGDRTPPGRASSAARSVPSTEVPEDTINVSEPMADAMRMALGSIGVKDPMKRVRQIVRQK